MLPNKKFANRPPVLTLSINSEKALYAVYIPQLKNGGMFVPDSPRTTQHKLRLGDEAFLLFSLPNEQSRIPVPCKVAWITPPNAQNNRPGGIGVHFDNCETGREAKQKIETILANRLQSQHRTYTF